MAELVDLRLKIADRQCHQCLFSKNRIVSLQRKNQIIQECIDKDKNFECHVGTSVGSKIICRGFYQRHSTNTIRMATKLEIIEFVDPYDAIVKKPTDGRKIL